MLVQPANRVRVRRCMDGVDGKRRTAASIMSMRWRKKSDGICKC